MLCDVEFEVVIELEDGLSKMWIAGADSLRVGKKGLATDDIGGIIDSAEICLFCWECGKNANGDDKSSSVLSALSLRFIRSAFNLLDPVEVACKIVVLSGAECRGVENTTFKFDGSSNIAPTPERCWGFWRAKGSFVPGDDGDCCEGWAFSAVIVVGEADWTSWDGDVGDGFFDLEDEFSFKGSGDASACLLTLFFLADSFNFSHRSLYFARSSCCNLIIWKF